ncbi:MAG: hypothetical protein H6716_29020 [Polyangiaceae bacterium]|nr:hypothetical protein [Polyangiaceae bacterium]
MGPSWITEAKRLGVLKVAADLGLQQRGQAIGPCPAGCKRRSSTDRRLPVGVRRDDQGWRCFNCDLSGDVPDLAAWALEGASLRELAHEARERVRAFFSERWGQGEWHSHDMPGERPSPPQPCAQRPYPPREELRALLDVTLPVTDHDVVATWLSRRGFNPHTVTNRRLACALPGDVEVPAWACFGEGYPWTRSGHRCLLPTYDAQGVLRSVRARHVGMEPSSAKALPPTGYAAAGLVLANVEAREMLHTGKAPSSWPEYLPLNLIITEGEPQFLAWACNGDDCTPSMPPVLGIVSGAWTPEIASRVPDRTRVFVATDHDVAGHRYAQDIALTLGRRCCVQRWYPTSTLPLQEALP